MLQLYMTVKALREMLVYERVDIEYTYVQVIHFMLNTEGGGMSWPN